MEFFNTADAWHCITKGNATETEHSEDIFNNFFAWVKQLCIKIKFKILKKKLNNKNSQAH